MLGDSQLDPRGRGLWPHSPEGPPVQAVPPVPSDCHDSFCSNTRPPSLGPRASTSCCCDWRAFSPRRVPSALSCTKEWTALSCVGDQREGTGCDLAFYSPSAWGCLPTGQPQILYNPRSVLGVDMLYTCACKRRASVNSSRNMHFGTRLVTSHTSLALRPCFHLK